ncbi:MAG: glycosyltransferase family 4 protein [Armatimonadota bacterium]
MNKLTILHTEASTGWGGQEIRILAESDGMIKRGHRVLLACQPESGISKKSEALGIETHIMHIGGAFDLACIMRMRDLIRREHVDIVNTHSSKDSWSAGFASKLAGCAKLIRTRHLSIPIKPSFESKLLYKGLPDAVVTTGESLRLHVIEQTGASADRVVSIPTGIDLQRFNPDTADGVSFRRDFGIELDAPLVGTVGMLRSMKGHTYFINAAAKIAEQVPEARFVIVGDTASASDIKTRLSNQIKSLSLQDKVIMTGYRDDVPYVLAALDIFVLASTQYEGVPQAISQAMAMRKPVVATDVGSINEQVITGNTGILVEKANADMMADAILDLIRDPTKASESGINGRRLVEEKFSLDAMLNSTESLYTSLLCK